ncbi:MAG: hypothetical protein QFE16_02085 [Pseudomonadota bacterium]|nr:hypothetical protein [Pseudomonadota bacterium]
MLTIRVFLSSPGDVAEERRLAVDTMRALEDSPLLRDRVNLQVVAWDDPAAGAPLDARETPQASVNRWAGRPADCDLTLVILWSRLGTPLPASLRRADGSRFASGTVWEVEDAIAANRPVFIYRRTEKPRIELDDPAFDAKRAQYDALRRWFDSLRDADGAWRSGVNEYANPAQFQELLRTHLEAFISSRLAPDRPPAPGETAAAGPAAPAVPARQAASIAPASLPRVRPRWQVPAAIGGLLVAGALTWAWRSGGGPAAPPPGAISAAPEGPFAPAPEASTTEHAGATPATGSLPQVRLAGPAEAKFTAIREATYTVLALTPEAGTSDHWRLRVSVRLATGAHSGGMNFWDSSFRLLVDGVPRAPVSTLNELVESGAAKDGELVFNLPWALRTLTLRIVHYAETTELPFAVSGARTPQPVSLPAGPRRVKLDGPAELEFPRLPHAAYTILAVGTEARRPGIFGLRIRIRMQVLEGFGGNFWGSQFRLLVDGIPREPDTAPNKLVGAGAAEDGDITFEVPDGARQLTLRVIHTAELTADVPLKLEPVK